MTLVPRDSTRGGPRKRRVVALFVLVPLFLSAQEMPVPIRIQYPILLKTLTFDRNLKTRAEDGIHIGVLYQSTFRPSLNAADELLSFARDFSVQAVDSLPLHLVPIDLAETAALSDTVDVRHIDLFYVLPLRAVSFDALCAIARTKKILTLTGVPEYVERGLSIGVDVKGQRPSLIIDITASREEGADLDSQLLNLARIIR